MSMGAKWRVGDGLCIIVFKDNWIPDASGGRVTASVTVVDANMKVADLIDANLGCWKNNLVDSCLLPFDATRIKAIPLSDLPQSDLMYWALERSGEASSSNSGLVAGFWTNTWKLGVPGKVKHFLWRACTNSLPTKINLVCHLCGRPDEDTLHALWGCEAVKQVWDRDLNLVNQFEAAQGSFQDLVAKVLSKPRVREVFATTTWFI